METLGELKSHGTYAYPCCDKEQLVRNYKLETGMTIQAESVELVLHSLHTHIKTLEWRLDQVRRMVG